MRNRNIIYKEVNFVHVLKNLFSNIKKVMTWRIFIFTIPS